MRVHINGELHEEVRRIFEVLYLGSVISKDAGVSVDMRQIVNEGVATYGGDEEYLENEGDWNEGKERAV